MNKDILIKASQDLHSVRDIQRWIVTQFNEAGLFYGHGTDNAWDEAAWLIMSSLNIEPNRFDDILDSRLTHEERIKILNIAAQRIQLRMPLAYLLKQAWFAGLPFYVNEHVLIPRSPCAELIEQHFVPWCEPEHVSNILDLCTGSGCIAIACAIAFPEAMVDAVDISDEALSVAKKNVETYYLEDRVHLIQSDLFNDIPKKQYDIIITNPPYVDVDEMKYLPDEYKHEPFLGLAGGEDGLDLVKKILLSAAPYLTPNGVIIVEVGSSQEALMRQYPDVSFTWLEFSEGGEGIFLLTYDEVKLFVHQ